MGRYLDLLAYDINDRNDKSPSEGAPSVVNVVSVVPQTVRETPSEDLDRARRELEEAVEDIGARWCRLPPDPRPDLDPTEDWRLEEKINRAFRAGDPEAAMLAVRNWREAWEWLLPAEATGAKVNRPAGDLEDSGRGCP